MLGYRGPAQPSPTISKRAALAAQLQQSPLLEKIDGQVSRAAVWAGDPALS
jgi:hypothetical protein